MKSESKGEYATIVVLFTAFAFLSLKTSNDFWLFIGMTLGIVSLISNLIALKIHQAWLLFSKVLEAIMPRVIFSFIFVLFLIPLAFISRIFTKGDILFLKRKTNSTFTDNRDVYSKSYFEKLW